MRAGNDLLRSESPVGQQRRGRAARRAERNAPAAAGERAVWPGLSGGRYRPLTEAELLRIHRTALDLLDRLGMAAAPASMIELVTAAGGRLTEDGRLIFPRGLVEDVIARARRDFVLHGHDPAHDLEISGSRVHFGSGGASPNLIDFETGRYRGAELADLYDIARLVDRLDNIHFYNRSVVARDLPSKRDLDLNTAYAALQGTSKHIGTSFTGGAHLGEAIAMFDLLLGGEGRFRDRSFCTLLACHVVPPLRFAEESCEAVEAAVGHGMPVMLISAGQAGATSPAALAGSVVQTVAEVLAGLVFAHLIDPDCRCIFAAKPFVSDLRSGAMSGGSGEQAVLMAASAQMARFYDLASSVCAGMTDAKIPDAQSGYEKGYTTVLAAQAGANMITQASGMQASLLGCSFEGYVIDNDMLGAVLRSVRGIEVSDETLSYEVISQVVAGEGHFLGHAQTIKGMTRDYLYPEVGDRESPEDWADHGSSDVRERAKARVREILAEHYPRHITEATDARIRETFDIRLPRRLMRAGNGRW